MKWLVLNSIFLDSSWIYFGPINVKTGSSPAQILSLMGHTFGPQLIYKMKEKIIKILLYRKKVRINHSEKEKEERRKIKSVKKRGHRKALGNGTKALKAA